MRKIRLGVRLAQFENHGPKPGQGLVEMFDIETGQAIEALCDFALSIPVEGAVSVTVKFLIESLEIKGEVKKL